MVLPNFFADPFCELYLSKIDEYNAQNDYPNFFLSLPFCVLGSSKIDDYNAQYDSPNVFLFLQTRSVRYIHKKSKKPKNCIMFNTK